MTDNASFKKIHIYFLIKGNNGKEMNFFILLWRPAWKPEYWNPKIRLGFAKRISAETNLCEHFHDNGRESTVPEATGLETDGENLEGWWSLSGLPRAYLRRLSKQSRVKIQESTFRQSREFSLRVSSVQS
jgi:hypothetical protein